MNPDNYWLCLVVLILAAFRLAVLFADDSGPFDILSRLRSFLTRKARTDPIVRKSKVHEGIQCKRCNSIWIGIILSSWVFIHSSLPTWFMLLGDATILALALSGAAIVIVRAFPETK